MRLTELQFHQPPTDSYPTHQLDERQRVSAVLVALSAATQAAVESVDEALNAFYSHFKIQASTQQSQRRVDRVAVTARQRNAFS